MESMEEAIEVEEEGERSRHDHEAEPVGALPLSRPLHRKRFLLGPYARPMPMGTSLMRKRLTLGSCCRPIYRGTSLIRTPL